MEKDLENDLDDFAGYANPNEQLDIGAVFIGLVNFVLAHLQFEKPVIKKNLYKNYVKNH